MPEVTYREAIRDTLGGFAIRVAAQVLLVLGLGVRELSRALACEAEQFLDITQKQEAGGEAAHL